MEGDILNVVQPALGCQQRCILYTRLDAVRAFAHPDGYLLSNSWQSEHHLTEKIPQWHGLGSLDDNLILEKAIWRFRIRSEEKLDGLGVPRKSPHSVREETHDGASSSSGHAAATAPGHKVFPRPARNSDREAESGVDGGREEVHGSLVVAGRQASHALEHSFQDQALEVLSAAAGLLVAVVRVEVDVTHQLVDAEAFLIEDAEVGEQVERKARVGVDDIHEGSVAGIQANLRWHVEEVGSGRVQPWHVATTSRRWSSVTVMRPSLSRRSPA